MKPYTRANLYAEIAKRDRRIRALERDNRLLREAVSKESAAVSQMAMRLYNGADVHQTADGCQRSIHAPAHLSKAWQNACARLAAKRKEGK